MFCDSSTLYLGKSHCNRRERRNGQSGGNYVSLYLSFGRECEHRRGQAIIVTHFSAILSLQVELIAKSIDVSEQGSIVGSGDKTLCGSVLQTAKNGLQLICRGR